jgi:hypothetical protein
MSGYLQRIALAALRPGDSIQPVLGSFFAQPEAPAKPELPSLESEEAVGTRARSQTETRTDVTSPFGTAPARGFPASDPDSPDLELAELAARPISTSDRAPGEPGRTQQQKMGIEPLIPADGSAQHQEEAPKREREPAARPRLERIHQTREPAPANSIATAQAPRERAMKSVQADRAAGMASIPTGTSVRPLVETPAKQPGPQTNAGNYVKRVIGILRGEPASRKSIPREETSTKRPVNTPRIEWTLETGAARQDVRMPPTTPSFRFRSGSEAKEGSGPMRRSLGSEPDEIQIHIGRIEVVAAQPAPAQAVPQRAPRITPSLDEYLRRRDRRSG